MQYHTKWFTLVELVVVATILAILSAVWFVAYTGYISWARDSNRLAQLENIRSGLQSYAIKWSLPLPADYVTVKDWSETLWYQWYAWENILDTIWLQKGWKDPKDDTYFSYYLSKSRNNFQLLWFLEEQSDSSLSNFVNTSYAVDYSTKYPIVTWEGLGILLGTWVDQNTPIQEIETIKTATSLDIWSTATEYQAVIKNNNIITWDSTELSIIASLAKTGGFIWKSCKDTIDANPWLLWQNGTYSIKPQDDIIEVFCDMTEDGWWWTLYSAKGTYGFSNSSMQENSLLKEYLDFWEFMWIFTSPSWTVASYRYKFFNTEEGKRAFAIGTWTSYDNALWWDDSSIHYSSPWELASAVNITYHDTTGTTTAELQSYIAWDTDTFFSWWRRSSNNQVWLWMMTYGMYYHSAVRSNYLWFPQTTYTGTWRVWSDTFTWENTWTDGRSVSIWLR
jgi:type II secretory pathway pseudopilin PulG